MVLYTNGGFRMDKRLEAKFSRMLEQIKKGLVEGSQAIAYDRSTKADDIRDEGDIAANEINHGMTIRLSNRENLYLKKIESAIKRIQSGTYGECTECGSDINIKRLMVRPTAELCINCKEEHEKREKSSIDGHKSKSLGKRLQIN